MKVTSEGERFRVENGRGETLLLTHDELQSLLQHAQEILNRPTSRRPGSPRPVPTMSDVRVSAATDIHRTVALLIVRRGDGQEIAYELPPDTARAIRDGLTEALELIASSKPSRQ
ncbi:MAG: hypothetical protein HXY30_19700 [Pseudorhodoplanes sp.]|nr:hypothetical protein [Pseudorhodoplanes sp.]